MEYTEKIEIDRIEVSDFGIILVRQATTIENDSDGKGDYIKEWNHPTYPEPTKFAFHWETN